MKAFWGKLSDNQRAHGDEPALLRPSLATTALGTHFEEHFPYHMPKNLPIFPQNAAIMFCKATFIFISRFQRAVFSKSCLYRAPPYWMIQKSCPMGCLLGRKIVFKIFRIHRGASLRQVGSLQKVMPPTFSVNPKNPSNTFCKGRITCMLNFQFLY